MLLAFLGGSKEAISTMWATLKALAILSDTTAKRFAVDREDLKPYWK